MVTVLRVAPATFSFVLLLRYLLVPDFILQLRVVVLHAHPGEVLRLVPCALLGFGVVVVVHAVLFALDLLPRPRELFAHKHLFLCCRDEIGEGREGGCFFFFFCGCWKK